MSAVAQVLKTYMHLQPESHRQSWEESPVWGKNSQEQQNKMWKKDKQFRIYFSHEPADPGQTPDMQL